MRVTEDAREAGGMCSPVRPLHPFVFPIIILTHCWLVHVLDGCTSRRRDSRSEEGVVGRHAVRYHSSFFFSLRHFTYSLYYGTTSGRSFLFSSLLLPPYYCPHGS